MPSSVAISTGVSVSPGKEILCKAHPQFSLLAAKLGVAGHSEKRIVAAGTAYLDELRTLDFGGAAIQYKVIFEDLPIAYLCDRRRPRFYRRAPQPAGGAHQSSMRVSAVTWPPP